MVYRLKEFNLCWINASDDALIKQLLAKNDKKVFEELELIFKEESIWKTISKNIELDDLNNTNIV